MVYVSDNRGNTTRPDWQHKESKKDMEQKEEDVPVRMEEKEEKEEKEEEKSLHSLLVMEFFKLYAEALKTWFVNLEGFDLHPRNSEGDRVCFTVSKLWSDAPFLDRMEALNEIMLHLHTTQYGKYQSTSTTLDSQKTVRLHARPILVNCMRITTAEMGHAIKQFLGKHDFILALITYVILWDTPCSKQVAQRDQPATLKQFNEQAESKDENFSPCCSYHSGCMKMYPHQIFLLSEACSNGEIAVIELIVSQLTTYIPPVVKDVAEALREFNLGVWLTVFSIAAEAKKLDVMKYLHSVLKFNRRALEKVHHTAYYNGRRDDGSNDTDVCLWYAKTFRLTAKDIACVIKTNEDILKNIKKVMEDSNVMKEVTSKLGRSNVAGAAGVASAASAASADAPTGNGEELM